ncbi:MAG: DUF308 domain-containing protein [Phycisphaerales bacterium]|jgi:uncharacterized membrane protein HdeD (DUF308 family)|nr:DUF308 domain-containing protein [Phycisphaerales bacterium]
MDPSHTAAGPGPDQILEMLRRGRGVLRAEAILCTIGGMAAVIFPVFASQGIELLLGVLCVVIGVLGILRSLAGGAEHRATTFGSAVLIGVLGALLLIWPFEGLEAITLVLAIGSLARGIADLTGFPHRSVVAPGMQVFSGLAGIAVGGLLLWWYPGDVTWAPGLLFGIQLIFVGMTLWALCAAVGSPVASPPDLDTAA